jgi:hypothetical protein
LLEYESEIWNEHVQQIPNYLLAINFTVKRTYFRQAQMVEIVSLEQRPAMLQPGIQLGQEDVDELKMKKFQHHYEQYRNEVLVSNYDVVVQTI